MLLGELISRWLWQSASPGLAFIGAMLMLVASVWRLGCWIDKMWHSRQA